MKSKLMAVLAIPILSAFAVATAAWAQVQPQTQEQVSAPAEQSKETNSALKQSVNTENKLRTDLLEQEQKLPQDTEMLAEARLALAAYLISKNKYSAAGELVEMALDSQEKHFGINHKKTKLALQFLFSIYLNGNSKSFSKEEIAKLEKLLGKLAKIDKEQTAKLSVQLADRYILDNEPVEAEKLWFNCIKMLRQNLPSNCRDLASACSQIFRILIHQKRFDDAQALARGMAQYGFNKDVLISAANGFLVLSQQQEGFGNTNEAAHLAKRALETAEKYGDKKTCSFTSASKQYVTLLKKQGKSKEASAIENAQ